MVSRRLSASKAMESEERPDLAALWMPFTANRAFKRAPRLLASA